MAKTPLRERSVSNEPAPQSGDEEGWKTTPLRVPKRDASSRMHPSQLSRRASSTINRLKTSSLVSQSPFRTQIPAPSRPTSLQPTPSPRRVSGEKRPRPSSMHSQAENEKPQGFKRRQSKGLQGLGEKESVSKSPFRKPVPDTESPPVLPPKPSQPTPSRLPTPSPAPSSPQRSSLVSKRLHGPRTPGHETGRRQRRKTVTFDPRCDVLEFDRDDYMDEEPFMTSDEEEEFETPYDHYSHDDGPEDPQAQEPVYADTPRSLGPDDSITGLVESMLQDARPQTPPQDGHLPPDMEEENGVPYGRNHHAEHAAAQHSQLQTPPDTSSDHTELSDPVTPDTGRRSPGWDTPSTGELDGSDGELDDGVQAIPPSPSPSKRAHLHSSDYDPELSSGADSISGGREEMGGPEPTDPDVQVVELSFMSNSDIQEELERSTHSIGHSDVSFGALETELGLTPGRHSSSHTPTSTPPLRPRNSGSLRRELPVLPRSRSGSPPPVSSLTRIASPPVARSSSPAAPISSRHVSDHGSAIVASFDEVLSLSNSTSSQNDASSTERNPRIRKEDVHRKLLHKRSMESPVPEPALIHSIKAELDHKPADDGADDDDGPDIGNSTIDMDLDDSLPPPSSNLRRESNFTYDGVMSVDPQEQPIDPPRPHVLARAASENDAPNLPSTSFHGLQFDISESSEFELGFSGMNFTEQVEIGEVKSALDKLVEDVSTNPPRNRPLLRGHVRVESVTEGIPAQQLMVANPSAGEVREPDEHDDQEPPDDPQSSPSALLHGDGFRSMPVSRSTSSASIPPPIPPKDAIRSREQAILEKRRALRRAEEDEAMGRTTPPRQSKRRSMSHGDATPRPMRPMGPDRGESLEDIVPNEDVDLEDVISRELHKRDNGKNYHVREHETIYASADAGKFMHMKGAGDIDGGKAWRVVRRPSDMNEYAKQIREYRTQEKPGKGHGKVFVRVIGARTLKVPIPQQASVLTCTLNNGIHFVTTPECRLAQDSRVDQEFELIEHSKLEFTLTLKVRRDPHIMAQFKANTPPPVRAPAPALPPPASKGGMRSFFSSSPKKPSKVASPQPSPPVHRIEENLARYLKPDGTLARAFVSFKEIAKHCDTRLFETTFPLIGQRLEMGNKVSSMQVGELQLQFFRLPPLPGVPTSQLPQSLDECHRGLRHVHWHKMTYFEGILTQNGGDCTTWRRRQFRIIGANLIAFNDVTKRAIASIDLRKAVGVEDLQDPDARLMSPTPSKLLYDEYDFGVERSFRLIFKGEEGILFFADSDEEKARWLEVLRALVGRIPPNPLWAELLWQRQQELGLSSALGSAQPPKS